MMSIVLECYIVNFILTHKFIHERMAYVFHFGPFDWLVSYEFAHLIVLGSLRVEGIGKRRLPIGTKFGYWRCVSVSNSRIRCKRIWVLSCWVGEWVEALIFTHQVFTTIFLTPIWIFARVLRVRMPSFLVLSWLEILFWQCLNEVFAIKEFSNTFWEHLTQLCLISLRQVHALKQVVFIRQGKLTISSKFQMHLGIVLRDFNFAIRLTLYE